MPITSGAKKALRSSKTKRVFNVRRAEKAAKLINQIRKLVKAQKTEDAEKLLSSAYKALDKAAKAHTIKKNTASRKKSRLAKLIKTLK